MRANNHGGVLLRVITGVTALVIFLFAIWMPGMRPLFTALVTILVFVGLYELFAIARAKKISPETIGGMLAGTIVALSGHFGITLVTNFLLYGGCLLVAALHIVRGQYAVAGLAGTIFGLVYVGWFGAHIVLLHGLGAKGPALVTLLFVAVASQTPAHFSWARRLVVTSSRRRRVPARRGKAPLAVCSASVIGMAVHVRGIAQDYPAAHFPTGRSGTMLYAGAVCRSHRKSATWRNRY